MRKNPLDDKPDLITDPVFIVGNGESRKDFNIESLKDKGTIIGCNALYRSFSPDILIVRNYGMMEEVKEYCKNNLCIVPWRNQKPNLRAREWRIKETNSAGCLAIKLVSLLIQPKYCYMLGMDGYEGNIYDGTENYETDKRRNLDKMAFYNARAVKESEKTIFVNVNIKNGWKIREHDNYEFITYKEFEQRI